MARTNRHLITNEYQDSDGYWIELKDGWQNGDDPGTHGIVEDTRKAAYATLRNAQPCACSECVQRLFEATLKDGMTVRIGTMARTDAIGKVSHLDRQRGTCEVTLPNWQADGYPLHCNCRFDELRPVPRARKLR